MLVQHLCYIKTKKYRIHVYRKMIYTIVYKIQVLGSIFEQCCIPNHVIKKCIIKRLMCKQCFNIFYLFSDSSIAARKWILNMNMSRVVRKPAFCIYENKDADQLRGNHEADQRLCFRYIDRTIPLLSKSEISSI